MTSRFVVLNCVTGLALFQGIVTPVLAQHSQQPCQESSSIQIGSYNIELLGSHRKPYGGVDRGPRSDAEIDRLAKRISTTLDLEIVVFQEINTASEEWNKLKGKLAADGYDFFEGKSSDRNQFVVLAWDKDEVQIQAPAEELEVRAEFTLPNGCSETGLRKPVAGRFKAGQFDFWVIGVHLKSRSGQESCTSRIRAEQCKDLVAKIDTLRQQHGESDFLIVGDCNENIGHVSFNPLVEAGFVSQMKFRPTESADGSYIKTGSLHESEDLIDHVWLRYSDSREVVRHSAIVMRLDSAADTKKYIIEQSDHVPAWVSFRIDEDLDDDDDD